MWKFHLRIKPIKCSIWTSCPSLYIHGLNSMWRKCQRWSQRIYILICFIYYYTSIQKFKMAKNCRKQCTKFLHHKVVLLSSVKMLGINSVWISFHTFVFGCHQQGNWFLFLILGGPFQTLDRTTRQINKELQMGFYCSLAVTENST